MGLDFLKDSKRADLEDEEDLEIFPTKTLDLYYTSAVDFKYSIVKGDIWVWDDGYDLNVAWETTISKLKNKAHNYNYYIQKTITRPVSVSTNTMIDTILQLF